MDEPLTTRHSLILRLRDPVDAAAWNEFVDLYEPLVYGLARRKGLQDADARDLCQEVFLAVSRAIERWEPDPARGSFRGWLCRVAQLVDQLPDTAGSSPARQRGQQCSTNARGPTRCGPSGNRVFEVEYKMRVIRWAADQIKGEFTPPTWQAFWHTAVDGKAPKDVALALSLSVGAVYIARSRVLARLRQRVEQLGDDAAIILDEVEHGTPPESM